MRINGREEKLEKEMTVKEYLSRHAFDERKVAIELDGSIIPRADFGSTYLRHDSSVEVVSFVGGG